MFRIIALAFVVFLAACDSGGGDGTSRPLECVQRGLECGPTFGEDGPLHCGDCPEGELCGLVMSNRCDVCTPRTCADVAAECGTIHDGCGRVIECGDCTIEGEACGIRQANRCDPCTPTTCAMQGAECGLVQDGCGNELECGTCGTGEECGWGNRCQQCWPASCARSECGTKDDGCGGTVDCGPCPTSSTTRVVPLRARNLVADPVRGKLYASVPSAAGASGNSIAVIDAAAGTIERSFFVGSEPNALALSGDGRTLWVGLDGSSAIVQVDLETDEVVATLPISGSTTGDNLARDILVSPAGGSTIVVAIGSGSFVRALAAYRDGAPLGVQATGSLGEAFAFAPDGKTLYEAHWTGRLNVRTVDESGVGASELVSDVMGRDITRMVLANGKLHCSNGRIFDLETGALAGTLQAAGLFDHEPAAARSYFVPWNLSSSFERAVISVFSTETFVPLGPVDLKQVDSFERTVAMSRYADDGLAILLEDELWLVESEAL